MTMIVQCVATSLLYFVPLNKIMTHVNTTRGVNDDGLMTLDHERGMMQDMQKSITIRNFERGSRAASTLSTSKIMLQVLPRVNFEIEFLLALNMLSCVKFLMLHKIKHLVSFTCTRKWKINFNL